jgi:hypothetical protein
MFEALQRLLDDALKDLTRWLNRFDLARETGTIQKPTHSKTETIREKLNKQTNKQTNNQTNKQTNKQTPTNKYSKKKIQ